MHRKLSRVHAGLVSTGVALAVGLVGAASADAARNPGYGCVTPGPPSQTTSCVSDQMTIDAYMWADISLACPDDRPNVTGVKTATGLINYGTYDDGPADGGHFWIRVNNVAPIDIKFKVTYNCKAAKQESDDGRIH